MKAPIDGPVNPKYRLDHRSGCAPAHTSWLAASLPASTLCKISLPYCWHSSLRLNTTEQHHFGCIPFCNLTHCQPTYHQKVQMKLKKTRPMNLKDLRTKTGMVMSLIWILGLCEITSPFTRDSLKKSTVTYHDFLDGLEYQLQFEDERMLDMVEHEGASFWQLTQNCLSQECHMNMLRGSSLPTWERETLNVMFYCTRPPHHDRDSWSIPCSYQSTTTFGIKFYIILASLKCANIHYRTKLPSSPQLVPSFWVVYLHTPASSVSLALTYINFYNTILHLTVAQNFLDFFFPVLFCILYI